MQLIRDKDKLYQKVEAGPWQGLAPIKATEGPIQHRWTGPKRTIEQHRQVLAFFEWSHQTHKSEALVYWLVNGERWQPFAPPQKGRGMTVKVVEDHPDYRASFTRAGLEGGELMGTDHHHCSCSAFQSGTDSHDELSREGLHLTVGDLGKPNYSLHGRSSFRQLITGIDWSEWFAVPEEYQHFPAGVQAAILPHLLTAAVPSCIPGQDFPEWWAENYLLEPAPAAIIRTPYTPPARTPAKQATFYSSPKDDLQEFCAKRGMSAHDLEEWIDSLMSVDGIDDLVDIAIWNYCSLRELEVEAMALSSQEDLAALKEDKDTEDFYQKMFDC